MPLTDEERKARRREQNKKYYNAHRREYLRKWCKANREKTREYRRKYLKEHREKIREREKKYREEHREKLNEKAREYFKEHREKIREYNKKYREANHEKIRKYQKEWREADRERLTEYRKRCHEERRYKELKTRRDFGYLPDKGNDNAQLRRYTVHLINSSSTFLAASALEACEIAAQHYGWTRIAEPETNGNDYCRYTCFSAKHDTFYITAKLKGDNK